MKHLPAALILVILLPFFGWWSFVSAFEQNVLWQGKIKNTETRIVLYDQDNWSFEFKSFDEWRRLEDTKLQAEILKEVCKRQ